MTKKEKGRLGWSIIAGTVSGAATVSLVLHNYLQSQAPALEAVGGSLITFFLIGSIVTGAVYGFLSLGVPKEE